MKFRFRENTLRVRITQNELKSLIEGESIFSELHFSGSSSLGYGLSLHQDENTQIEFKDHKIHIRIGELDMETLSDEKSVGVQSTHGDAQTAMQLLIEKDFTCLHPRGEEDVDTFPNPNSKAIT